MASVAEEEMLASLLPFHRRIVEELIEEDGLCVLSAGMGWQKVVRCHVASFERIPEFASMKLNLKHKCKATVLIVARGLDAVR